MSKLVSLRINEKALQALDNHMTSFPYRKKHSVLVSLIENILLNVDSQTLRNIVYYNPHSSTKLSISATITSTVK